MYGNYVLYLINTEPQIGWWSSWISNINQDYVALSCTVWRDPKREENWHSTKVPWFCPYCNVRVGDDGEEERDINVSWSDDPEL